MTTQLITTAIPYVNASPHLGFAYELVLADALARHGRRRGRDVRFTTGTDDHSLKNVAAAVRAGVSTRALVDRNASAFRDLGRLLDVGADDFVATSTDPRHRVAVDWLWRACAARGDLFRQAWNGLHCAGCEAFVDDPAPCPEHGVPPEPVTETNWFFRLSRYREPVRDAIASGRLAIVPDAARAEALAFLGGPVRDLSVSRDAVRAAGWGIAVPDDPDQVIYVWFDALANYLTSLGLGGDGAALVERYWHRGERVHVIGKGITRFHAVYWPAFLLSAGLPLPDRILVHGYLTVDGVKISKSGRGAAVDPVVADVGADALRWYFARRCPTRTDSDVSRDGIVAAHDGDLVGRLGNLVQRCRALAAQVGGGRVPAPAAADAAAGSLRAAAEALPGRVDAALAAFDLAAAAAAIVELADDANRALDHAAPWRLARTDRAGAASALHAPLEAARIAAGELSPLVPGVSRALAHHLGDADLAPGWGRLEPGAPLATTGPVLAPLGRGK